MDKKIKTENYQFWTYETDEFKGTCILAGDELTLKITITALATSFFDVLEIDEIIDRLLLTPVSVEGLADSLFAEFPRNWKIKVSGRAPSHGWITAEVMGDFDGTGK